MALATRDAGIAGADEQHDEDAELALASSMSTLGRPCHAARDRGPPLQVPTGCGRDGEVCLVNAEDGLPMLLTADETASLLRTSRKVIYEKIRLGRLPGVTRLGRRVLLRRDRLIEYLAEREEQPVSSLGGRP